MNLKFLVLTYLFTNHMVLQRDHPLHFWGKGLPGANVTVTFAGEQRSTLVKTDSTWSLYASPKKANIQPQQLTITSGSEKITLDDILIGDVWLCLGQSNMEFPMSREAHFRAEAYDQPLIRLYNPSYIGKDEYGKPYTDSMLAALQTSTFYSKANWQRCDSNTVKAMSAVGYYFGKTIANRKQIPIGLINLAIGGCPAETFINKTVLSVAKTQGNWLTNNTLPVWVRTRGQQNIAGNPHVPQDGQGPNHGYKPGFAYEAGVKTLMAMPIRGIIWYQGESNAQEQPRVDEYNALMKTMIADYRKNWHQPNLPFYWVQLSSIDTAHYPSQYWPAFRDQQRLLLNEVPYGGMAVCSDLGFKNDVHPTNKKEVGERLARWALADPLPSGPLPMKARYRNDTVVVTFRYGNLETSDQQPVRGFSLDGHTDVLAIIRGNTILIATPQKPEAIFYAWKPYTDANLCNTAKLPASTFKLIIP